MNRRLFSTLFATGLVLAVLFRAVPGADSPKISPRADALDLLLLEGEKPVHLELRVEVVGKSVPAIWDETFAKLLKFHDRNGDGFLDKTEAARLPSAFALRQVLWGQVSPFGGDAPTWEAIDLNTDGKVSGDEVADFYRRAGLGGVLVGVGKPPATDRLTDMLLKHLDTNKDGKVNEAEWKAAADSLRKLDANDDELIGPGELVEKTAYPGALGSILYSSPAPNSKSNAVADAMPFIVLPLRTADTHWATVVAARREKEKTPAIAAETLLSLRKAEPVVAWRVRFGDRHVPALESTGGKSPSNARLSYSTKQTQLELRADSGKLRDQSVDVWKRFSAQFAECDVDSSDSLDAKELGNPKASQFKQLLISVDQDGNGKLDKQELVAWFNLQDQIARGHILLTVLDHGNGLFELLDADHDGSLSVRELRTAWDRLKATGCVTEGQFDRTKLPRQLIAAVSRGHPRTAIGKPVHGGPEWFRAMDRNGDGDVSRREFTGPAEVFDKLDVDKDELLSAEEASKADVKK